MQKIKNFLNSLLGIVVIAALVRLVLMPITHHGDMENYIVWTADAYRNGLSGFYARDFALYLVGNYNYPPLILYVFTLFYLVYLWMQALIWQLNIMIPAFPSSLVPYIQGKEMLYFLYKIPSVLADIGSALLIYRLVIGYGKKYQKAAFIACLLFLFNPAIIYNSAIWGQIDSIPVFFLLLSFFFLLRAQKPELGVLSFTMGLLMKQSVIIFAPIIGIILLTRFPLRRTGMSLIVSVLFFYLSFLPFYDRGNLVAFAPLTYLYKVQFASNSHFVSKNAFNFWWIFSGTNYLSDTKRFLYVTLQQWGFIITGGLLLHTLIYAFRKFDEKKVLYASVLIAFFSFLFLTRMHERHLYNAVALMPLILFLSRKKIFFYCLISIFHLFNLYAIWGAFGFLPWTSPTIVFLRYATSFVFLLSFLYFWSYTFTPQHEAKPNKHPKRKQA